MATEVTSQHRLGRPSACILNSTQRQVSFITASCFFFVVVVVMYTSISSLKASAGTKVTADGRQYVPRGAKITQNRNTCNQ